MHNIEICRKQHFFSFLMSDGFILFALLPDIFSKLPFISFTHNQFENVHLINPIVDCKTNHLYHCIRFNVFFR